MNGANQIPMQWIHVPQFHRNSNIHAKIFLRLKCIGSRNFFLRFIKTIVSAARFGLPNLFKSCVFFSLPKFSSTPIQRGP
jgi:hypothetical protein